MHLFYTIKPMSRTFSYCRVSTLDQTTQNQILEIKAAGFSIEPQRIVEENISGSVAAKKRPGFCKLVDRLESGDILVVTKLDRLGRNAMDVRSTAEQLEEKNIRLHCLALGGVDLTSPAGKMAMGIITVIAEFERDLLIERTQSGMNRAKAEGKVLGRPQILITKQKDEIKEQLARNNNVSQAARDYNVSRKTIMRVRDNQY
mgnify:CR=1 FL=1